MAEDSILGFLQNNEVISDSQGFAANVGIDHNELENVIKSLRGFEIIDAQEFQKDRWFLKEEGKNYVREGTPEVQLFEAVPPEGISREDLQKKLNPTVFKIGSSWAVKKKWVEIGRQGVSRKEYIAVMVKWMNMMISNINFYYAQLVDKIKPKWKLTGANSN
ncbi:hypothetical protein HPP92_002245 [Vanilla planifolia]|uniref:PheRS DNA binding domain-containing protein n=1 Tax=Vanilla planifolia TaxID=51239 RepID=A0A835SEB6_VANPL|nr:hypothetical protein HPP92_002245 [Vanilla planifolia]